MIRTSEEPSRPLNIGQPPSGTGSGYLEAIWATVAGTNVAMRLRSH